MLYIFSMAERTSTYSKIISPEEYNRIISFEHLYISASDRVIKELIEFYRPKERMAEVVEIGCGPARVLPLIARIEGIHLTGVDHDSVFLEYAKQLVKEKSLPVDLINANITDWKLGKEIDICYSQGVHHHIGKKTDTKLYL
jgi:SAM-dependent methyltransferase